MKTAKEFFREGYNCSQSVFCQYCEQYGIDMETGLRLSSSFGGGIGRLRNVCGAVTAMCMVIGLKQGYSTPNNDQIKEIHYAKVQKLVRSFENKFGSIICKELLGLKSGDTSSKPTKRTKEFYETRPCEKFIEYAIKLLKDEVDNTK